MLGGLNDWSGRRSLGVGPGRVDRRRPIGHDWGFGPRTRGGEPGAEGRAVGATFPTARTAGRAVGGSDRTRPGWDLGGPRRFAPSTRRRHRSRRVRLDLQTYKADQSTSMPMPRFWGG